MKIISYGTQRIGCNCCRAVLEFDYNDVNIALDHGIHYVYWIDCPVCGNRIEIPGDKVKKLTKENLN